MKILMYDLETAPTLAYTFSLWQANIGHNQIVEPPRIICFSAQWYGSKKVIFKSEFHDGRKAMLEELHALFDEADVIVGYNNSGFDNSWSTGEFLADGMKPPSPYKSVDLFRTIKQVSRFPSKKLDYVAMRLLDERKVEHQGFSLWRGCMDGDAKSWAKMKQYAIQDTKLLAPLYDVLKPWIKNHPVAPLHDKIEGLACPVCSGTNTQRRGVAVTSAGVFPRYQCQDDGKWFRGSKRESTTEARNIP